MSLGLLPTRFHFRSRRDQGRDPRRSQGGNDHHPVWGRQKEEDGPETAGDAYRGYRPAEPYGGQGRSANPGREGRGEGGKPVRGGKVVMAIAMSGGARRGRRSPHPPKISGTAGKPRLTVFPQREANLRRQVIRTTSPGRTVAHASDAHEGVAGGHRRGTPRATAAKGRSGGERGREASSSQGQSKESSSLQTGFTLYQKRALSALSPTPPESRAQV